MIWYFGFYRPRLGGRGRRRPPAPPAVPARRSAARSAIQARRPPFTEAAEAWQRRVAEYQRWQRRRPAPANRPWPAPPPGNLGAVAHGCPVAPVGPAAVPVAPADPEQPTSERPSWPRRTRWVSTSEPVAANTSGSSVVRPRRRPSARRLGWATLLVLGLTLSGLGVADYLGAAITPRRVRRRRTAGRRASPWSWPPGSAGLAACCRSGSCSPSAVLGLSAAAARAPGLPPVGDPPRPLAYTTPAELPAGGDPAMSGTLTVDLSRLPIDTDTRTRPGSTSAAWTSSCLRMRGGRPVHRRRRRGEAFDRPVANGTELSGVVHRPETAATPGGPR